MNEEIKSIIDAVKRDIKCAVTNLDSACATAALIPDCPELIIASLNKAATKIDNTDSLTTKRFEAFVKTQDGEAERKEKKRLLVQKKKAKMLKLQAELDKLEKPIL